MNRSDISGEGSPDQGFWKELGLPDPAYEEGDGPALAAEDVALLRALLRRELPEVEVARINANIGRWRSWSRASAQLALELWQTKSSGEETT